MYEQYKFKFYLNASHAIHIDGILGEAHPHTWEIAIHTIRQEDNFKAFHEIEEKVEQLLQPYQDGFLNSQPSFQQINPTLENCCRYFCEVITAMLKMEGWKLLQIEMSETPTRSFIMKSTEEI